MARSIHKLSDTTARSDKLKPGRLSDGGGLYLNVSPSGSKSWVYMWTRNGKRREMGLGAYPAVPLSSARRAAAEHRATVAEDRDPLAEREKATEPTFGECADRLIASLEGYWRNEKHRYQWRMTLEDYCAPIRSKRVSGVNTNDVLSVLNPIWTTKAETAARLRGRIERVLDFAKVHGWRTGENPALWRGHLCNILPPQRKLTRGHLPAMPYSEVPAFLKRVREAEALAARALGREPKQPTAL